MSDKENTTEQKIEIIIELIRDGKLDKALEIADINEAKSLFDIGIQFGQNGVFDIAEKYLTESFK